jgi:hypothetical protein
MPLTVNFSEVCSLKSDVCDSGSNGCSSDDDVSYIAQRMKLVAQGGSSTAQLVTSFSYIRA